jgi:hypothetical protein
MKTRGLVALAIVAGAMAVFIAIDRWRSDDEPASARTRLLPAFDRQAVKRVTIRRKGSAFALLRAPSPSAPAPAPDWQLEIAGAPPADDAAVADLLAAVDLAESERTAEISPAAAGLQPPVAEIALQTASQVREARDVITLQLGKPDAAGRGVYARAGTAAPIRVVNRRVLELVDRDLAAFRDRRLFPIDPATVTAIEWRAVDGSGELRAVDGRWQNGRKEWIDEGRIAEALRRLIALRIDRFDVDDSRSLALRRGLIVTAGATRLELTLESGSATGEVIRAGERLHVPPDALAAAFRALNAALAPDRRLVAMPPDRIQRIDLNDERDRVSLQRADGAWTFTSPKVPYRADTRVVDEWLAQLASINTPTRGGGADTRHLIVEGRFRQQIDVSSPPDVYALLAPDPLRFRERALLSFARFDVRRLQRTAGKDVAQLTTDDGTTWRATSGAEVDTANAAQVVGALSDLRAEAFTAAPPPGAPAVKWQVDVQPPGEATPARHALEVWPRNDGGCSARLDADATFTPERAACTAFGLDLLSK